MGLPTELVGVRKEKAGLQVSNMFIVGELENAHLR